jgi:hypothetical protein
MGQIIASNDGAGCDQGRKLRVYPSLSEYGVIIVVAWASHSQLITIG